MGLRLTAVSRLAFMVGLGLVTGFGQARAQSLEDELSLLIAESPEINSLRNQVYAADEGINEAYAGFLPTVDVSGDSGYEYTDQPNTLTTVGEEVEAWRNRVTGTLRQRLFDGWGTQSNYDSSKLSREVAVATLENNTQDLLFQGARGYLEVLRAVALIGLAEQNVEVIQTQLNLETERVERGSGITLDELQAKTRLQIAQERLVAFRGALDQANARYERLFGHPPQVGSLMPPAIPEGEIPPSLLEAIAIAEAESPLMAGAQYNVELAEEAQDIANSPYYPTVDLVGRLNWEDDVDGTEGIRRDAALVVEANWILFNGFATDAQVARAAYQHVASVHDRAATQRIVVRDTELAWEQYFTSGERVGLLENAVNIAIEVHAARVRLRDAGQETVLNVLDAQNDVFNAQINLVGAQFDRYIGVYRLLQAMGRLTPDRVGATVPEEFSELRLDGDEYAVSAASADPETVALVTDPLPASAQAVEIEEETVVLAAVEPNLEIDAASDAIAWPETVEQTAAEQATETVAVQSVVAVEPAPEPVQTMTMTFQGFDGEIQPVDAVQPAAEPVETIAASFVPGTVIGDASDEANLTRSWSFE